MDGHRRRCQRRERDHAEKRRVRLLETDAHGVRVDHVRAVVRTQERASDAGRAESQPHDLRYVD